MSYYQSCSCEAGNQKVKFVLFEKGIESEALDESYFQNVSVLGIVLRLVVLGFVSKYFRGIATSY